jgi:Ca-activated chloride channel family protein
VIYGHEAFAGDDPRNCQAVKIARPLAALDESGRAVLLRQIATLRPVGATPIANAMRLAGDELAKNDALCGMVVLTDGLESCKGNPAGEASDLLGRLKIAFGVNVVGFGVKAEDDAILEGIAKAGGGKYYAADSSAELSERMSALAKELVAVAKPPEVVVANRRAIKVLEPEIDLVPMKEILLAEAGAAKNTLNSYVKARKQKFGEEIPVPSSTAKYDVWWVPKEGHPIQMVKDLSLPERKVVTLKPEDYLGLIQVGGQGPVKQILVVPTGTPDNTRTSYTVQEAKKFGDLLVVPAGKYDIWVDSNVLEEGLEVAPGKLLRLE